MMSSYARRAALGFALAATLVGCKATQLPLPDALDTAPLAVERPTLRASETGLRFGPYAATDVDRAWTRGHGAHAPRASADVRHQSYAFTFTTDDAPWRVACETNAHDFTLRGTPDVELAAGQALECTLRSETDGDWLLALRSKRDRPLSGHLTNHDAAFEIEGSQETTAGLRLAGTTGYHLRRDGQPVGAVETVNDGNVWLDTALAPRDRTALAAAAAALLLLQDVSADLTAEL